MKLLDKVKTTISNHPSRNPSPGPEPTDTVQATYPPPKLHDLIRYRSHHGTNLGSIFVLEKWLYPSMFEPDARGDSEYAAVIA